jgi:hypothetical protein
MAKVSFLFFCMLIPFAASTQPKVYIGFQGGGQLASAYIEHTLYFVDMKTGFISGKHGGILVRVLDFNQKKGLKTGYQTGLFYVERGWSQTYRVDSIPRSTTRLSYLNVPVNALIWAGGQKNRVYFKLGGFFEFLLNHETKNPPDNFILGTEVFYTYEPDRDNTFGYGLSVGAGIQKDFKFGSFILEGDISFALSDFIGITNRASATPDISNLYLGGVSIGYLFSLK